MVGLIVGAFLAGSAAVGGVIAVATRIKDRGFELELAPQPFDANRIVMHDPYHFTVRAPGGELVDVIATVVGEPSQAVPAFTALVVNGRAGPFKQGSFFEFGAQHVWGVAS